VSWVLEGRRREGKTYGVVNPYLRVLKNREMFWGVLKGFICPILKFPQIEGFWGVKHTN